MDAQALTCPHCGASLSPGSEPRVRCAHCGTVCEVLGEGSLRMARVLQQVGVRLPDNPMTIEDIEQELREREAVEREKRRTGLIVFFVVGGVAALVVLGLLLAR